LAFSGRDTVEIGPIAVKRVGHLKRGKRLPCEIAVVARA
jgi:hypothetical protein